MATVLCTSRACRASRYIAMTQRRCLSTSTVLERRMPSHRYSLTDEQLAEFGGKKALQKRLPELNLSPLGFRAVLRQRLKEYVDAKASVNPTKATNNE